MTLIANVDGAETELELTMTATPIEHPLAVKYVGDEPYYESVKGYPETLVLQLHSWSGDYTQCTLNQEFYGIDNCVWVSPNFGGPNNWLGAAGGEPQLERILRVISATKSRYASIKRTILFGYSGGGYLTMYLMGRFPELFDGFVSWYNVHSLADWYDERPGYRPTLEACFGFAPDTPARQQEYLRRSPKSVLGAMEGKVGYINSAGEDEEIYPIHQLDSYNMVRAKNPLVEYILDPTREHVFTPEIAGISLNQLLDVISKT